MCAFAAGPLHSVLTAPARSTMCVPFAAAPVRRVTVAYARDRQSTGNRDNRHGDAEQQRPREHIYS